MNKLVFSCLAFLALMGAEAFAEEFLPTPYTSDEIRDAWQVGFEVTTRAQTAEGLLFSRTEVLEWSQEGFRMSDRAVSAKGIPLDEEISYYSGTWIELRDHARFPASHATRERAAMGTPLGRLEGWLYRVRGEAGDSELFFADGLPGPPVVYRKSGNDGEEFVAEQVQRIP